MNIQRFWSDVLAQRADDIREYFHADAYVNWHCSNEHFTVEEFIRANCEYPGDWDGEIEKIVKADDMIITATRVYPKDRSASFRVTSFIKLKDDKIIAMDEYWADDGEAPKWRQYMKIGKPITIEIEDALRLRRFDGNYDFAFEWYQDPETVLLVDGKAEPYSYETLTNMYNYLNGKGELYFIEVNENGKWKPIGDVTFWQEDLPIVIGDREYRGKGIGKKVVSALVERGKAMGYDKLYVGEIYDFNIGSQKCFESVGFRSYEKTEKGSRYVQDLKE